MKIVLFIFLFFKINQISKNIEKTKITLLIELYLFADHVPYCYLKQQKKYEIINIITNK